MSDFTFTFPEPALPDLNDSEDYVLAVEFESSGDVSCVGVEWRVPDTVPTGECTVALWATSGEALLASKAVTFTGGQAGTLVKTYFDTPVDLNAGDDYRAGIYTPNRYVATTNYDWPETDGTLTALVTNGRLAFDFEFPATQSGNSANYHVSPIVDIVEAVDAVLAAVASAGTAQLAAASRADAALASTGSAAVAVLAAASRADSTLAAAPTGAVGALTAASRVDAVLAGVAAAAVASLNSGALPTPEATYRTRRVTAANGPTVASYAQTRPKVVT